MSSFSGKGVMLGSFRVGASFEELCNGVGDAWKSGSEVRLQSMDFNASYLVVPAAPMANNKMQLIILSDDFVSELQLAGDAAARKQVVHRFLENGIKVTASPEGDYTRVSPGWE